MDNFEAAEFQTDETTIFARWAGSGSPILLLHGFPQTHLMWRSVAPMLARNFTVVCADLRGYGRSGCPASTPDHAPYAKRAMAKDMVILMDQLGFGRFSVAGHDRGGRVAYRMALDQLRRSSTMRSKDGVLPRRYSRRRCVRPISRRSGIPRMPHAICEEYRAAATLDREHDKADSTEGRRIACPLLALWSAHGPLHTWYAGTGGPIALWQAWSADVQGHALNAGHFFPEETPEYTAEALNRFFATGSGERGQSNSYEDTLCQETDYP